MAYCERTDVYAIGLPAEAFARPARLVDGVIPASGVLALRSHGFKADAPVTLAVLSSSTLGAAPAELPGGLSVGVVYYAQPSGSDLFWLATAPGGGSTIPSFTDAGAGVMGVLVDHGLYLDAAIVAATSLINEYARAHEAPIQAEILPLVCAYLAVRIYVAAHAANNPGFAAAAEAPTWLRSLIDTLFRLWLTGAPMQKAVDATPLKAEMGAVVVALEGRRFLEEEGDRA